MINLSSDTRYKTKGKEIKMAHIKPLEPKGSGIKTPTEWLPVGYEIGLLVNEWAGRSDIVACIGDDKGGGAPACFFPSIAEVQVNTVEAFGEGITPNLIDDLTKRRNQFEFPKAIGAIMHEAFHAKFSKWEMAQAYKDLKQDEYEALMLLEEGRIEAQGIIGMPRAKNFLRASAMGLIIDEAKETFATNSSAGSACQLVGLAHARIIAGSLLESEAENLIKEVNDFLGVELVAKLITIIEKFQAHTLHSDITPCYPLAIEWAELVKQAKEEKGEPTAEEMESFAKMMSELMADMESEVSDKVSDDLSEQQESEKLKESADKKSMTSKEQKKNDEIAKQVFSKSSGPGEFSTASKLIEKRAPIASERNATVKIARALDKAKYREKDITEVSSITPPGRLRTRAIIQSKALAQRGIHTQPEAFRKTVRKHTDEPTLTVGIMVDISGSMSSAMKPMASTAWIMSEAVRRVQGRCAMVYYGSDVFPTLKAGQRLKEVSVYSAPDGTEKFDRAFRALDGSLNLINGQGARLLVVVSDGHYTNDETEKARSWLKACTQNGVAVLWLPIGDNGSQAREICKGANAQVVAGITSPTESALLIGRTAERVLSTAGQRKVA
jgi:hypothetical protein